MLKQPLSLIFHAELAVRLEYGARLQARPTQEFQLHRKETSNET